MAFGSHANYEAHRQLWCSSSYQQTLFRAGCVPGTPWEEQGRKRNGCPCATWGHSILQQPELGQVPAAQNSPGQHSRQSSIILRQQLCCSLSPSRRYGTNRAWSPFTQPTLYTDTQQAKKSVAESSLAL